MTRFARTFVPLAASAIVSLALTSVASAGQPAERTAPPLRLVVAGLAHGHVEGFFRQAAKAPVEIVGVYDADASLRARKLGAAGLAESLGSGDLDALLDRTKPEAVAIFSSTADHPRLVEIVARHRLPAMMEKPLAVSVADARAIEKAASASGIHVIVNYETTWYPALADAWRLMKTAPTGGVIRKMVAMDGHAGPQGDRRRPGVPVVADRPGAERRGRPVRLRLLRRQPDDVADGRRPAHERARPDAATEAAHLPERR